MRRSNEGVLSPVRPHKLAGRERSKVPKVLPGVVFPTATPLSALSPTKQIGMLVLLLLKVCKITKSHSPNDEQNDPVLLQLPSSATWREFLQQTRRSLKLTYFDAIGEISVRDVRDQEHTVQSITGTLLNTSLPPHLISCFFSVTHPFRPSASSK